MSCSPPLLQPLANTVASASKNDYQRLNIKKDTAGDTACPREHMRGRCCADRHNAREQQLCDIAIAQWWDTGSADQRSTLRYHIETVRHFLRQLTGLELRQEVIGTDPLYQILIKYTA